jgi:apolipoprotein N-acyltransferase
MTSLISFISSILYVFCFPGWNRGQLAWIALLPLILSALAAPSKKSAFLCSFLAGLAANLGTLYWVYPTCRAGGVNVAVSVLALAALSAYCALYWGAFGAFVRKTAGLRDWARPFIQAAGWTALEVLRGRFLSGFPWLFLGNSQWNVPQHLPLTEIGGPFIVSFMLVLLNGGAALLCKKRWKPALAPLAALIALVAASVALSKSYRPPEGKPLKVALIQGNIDQYKKWDAAYEMDIVNTYTRLTLEASEEKPDLIIWPESSVPGWIPNDPKYLRWLADLAKTVRTPLLIGAVTRARGDYNAAFLFDAEGKIVGRYRKRHLVPFGETIPFQSVLGRWIPVLNVLGEFDASDDWTVFPGGAAVDICFESLFPDLVRGFVARGAGFSVNMTNDGWYLDTSAPDQHFASAMFRAVENRTWFLSVANTGVTAFVDPTGRMQGRIPRGEPGIARGTILPDPRGTFYTRHGDLFAWLCAFASLAALFL